MKNNFNQEWMKDAQQAARWQASLAIAKNTDLSKDDLEELIQELLTHMMESWSSFDPQRSSQKTFMAHLCKAKTLRILKQWRQRKQQECSLEELTETNGAISSKSGLREPRYEVEDQLCLRIDLEPVLMKDPTLLLWSTILQHYSPSELTPLPFIPERSFKRCYLEEIRQQFLKNGLATYLPQTTHKEKDRRRQRSDADRCKELTALGLSLRNLLGTVSPEEMEEVRKLTDPIIQEAIKNRQKIEPD